VNGTGADLAAEASGNGRGGFAGVVWLCNNL
jgi:hypothetical protein